MLCLGCGVWAEGSLCRRCRIGLRAAPQRAVPGMGVVHVGYLHEGAARMLVHQLKYRGVIAAARLLSEGMAARLPVEDALLVPVPRVGWRRLRYGVDPALELAKALGARSGLAVGQILTAPFWGRSRAGRSHDSVPRFALSGRPRAHPGIILVDDVVTTGATLVSAARMVGPVIGAVTATGAVQAVPSRRRDPATSSGR